MKIAIIAPSPVPFTIGGAEKLWWGLLSQFNRMPGIQAELIKIPSPERNFKELIRSYQHFRQLDLSHFDAVISTKYPAWMVQHPNHVVYLQHRLRGLYDTYGFCNKPIAIPPAVLSNPLLKRLHHLLGSGPSSANIDALFAEIASLASSLGEAFDSVFEFPGPLSRQIIHFLDSFGLKAKRAEIGSAGGISKFAAIAHNVHQRKDYFPPGVDVAVMHHPSDLPFFKATSATHIFTVSRLDSAKRIGLLVQAYKNVKTDLPFLVAGSGPDLPALQSLAESDPRIRFVGRLNDEQVIAHYQASLFVPFIPYDEDYGLVTIEAMQSGRAVLTTQDAGGVNEFVEHGVSGLCVEPTAQALAQAMQQLVDNPSQTLHMGQNALKKVAHISWANTCEDLLDLLKGNTPLARMPLMPPMPRTPNAFARSATHEFSLNVHRPSWAGSVFNNTVKRKKVLVISPFRVTPVQSGGQARVYHLYKALSNQFDVTILSLGEFQTEPATIQITSAFREVVVPVNLAARLHFEKIHSALKVDCSDLAIIDGILLHPEFLIALRDLAQTADWVIASHPYLYKAIEATHRGSVVYDAHNVEFDMKAAVLKASPANGLAQEMLQATFQLEKQLLARSSAVVACSQLDLDRFAQLYPTTPVVKCVAPNGVDVSSIQFQPFSVKAGLQSAFAPHGALKFQKNANQLGIQAKEIALFAGSWHGPNINAMHKVVTLAQQVSDLLIVVMGSVTNHPDFVKLPANILPMGLVSDYEKKLLLNASTLMLNPMADGSGTNLKMLEYAAAGGSIISTAFGNRGLGFLAGEEVIIADSDHFADAVNTLRNMDAVSRQAMAQRARRRVEELFSWDSCASELLKCLSSNT